MKGQTSAVLQDPISSPSECHSMTRRSSVSSGRDLFIPAPAHGRILSEPLAPHPEEEGPSYPGTCASRSAEDAKDLGDRPFAWRFRVPRESIHWNDLFLGPVEIDPSRVGGDFIVARQGVGPSYQLAVVTDDAAMGVNQVIRGSDLVPSTPRQILLYRSLGWAEPTFGHVPLAVTPDGRTPFEA